MRWRLVALFLAPLVLVVACTTHRDATSTSLRRAPAVPTSAVASPIVAAPHGTELPPSSSPSITPQDNEAPSPTATPLPEAAASPEPSPAPSPEAPAPETAASAAPEPPSASSTPPEAVAPTAPPATQTPQQVVERFYQLLADRDFPAAYALLSPAYQATQPYAQWVDGYATTQSFTVQTQPTGDPNTVAVRLQATDRTSSGTVQRSFAGTWHLIPTPGGWLLDQAAIAQTAPVPSASSGFSFVTVTGNSPGRFASAVVQAPPGAQCSLGYVTPAGTQSTAQGLGLATTDAAGRASWTWLIGGNTRRGTGTVTVVCTPGGSATARITIG